MCVCVIRRGRQRKCWMDSIGERSEHPPAHCSQNCSQELPAAKTVEEDLCWIVRHVSPTTQSVKGLNWTDTATSPFPVLLSVTVFHFLWFCVLFFSVFLSVFLSVCLLPLRFLFCLSFLFLCLSLCLCVSQWGAADAEIKVPSGENTELKRSPFIAWSRSVYSHTCYAYCQGFRPYLCLPFRSVHLHFFQNLSQFFLFCLWLTPAPV